MRIVKNNAQRKLLRASELISETKCWMVVNYKDSDQISATVVNRRGNIDLRRSLGNNGRKAFLHKYNSAVMEQELYQIYDSLLK